MFVNSEAVLREDYPSVTELAASRSVVAIVRGTVSATRDVYMERVAYRILTVDVTRPMRGQVAKRITVLEEGGVVPYAQVAATVGLKDAAPTIPANTTGYVDFRFMGSRHSEVGDDIVLFLGANPNSGTAIDTDYSIVSSVHGLFTREAKTNTFVRGGASEGNGPGFVRFADLATIESAAGTR